MDRTEFLEEQLKLLEERKEEDSVTWLDINEFRCKNLGISESIDTTRKGAKLLSEYLFSGWQIIPPESNIDSKQCAIEIERKKLLSEKNEYLKAIRQQARDELILEHIAEAIKSTPSLPAPKPVEVTPNNKSYLLTLSDCHFGIEFILQGIDGKVINEYNPEIFQQRMSTLLSYVVDSVKKNNIEKLTIFELGDAIQGMLRLNSQLMQLRYGVIESAVHYAFYLSTWLNSLSHYVKIDFHMVKDSNHNQLRLCGAPKNAFPDENMSTVILTILNERLKSNPNISILSNPTGMNYAVLSGYPVLGIHGEVKDLKTAINTYSRAYSEPFSYIFAGHIHHKESAETGIDSQVISVGSIIGVDPYGLNRRLTSNATADLFCFEEGKGITCDYTFKLN